MSRLTATLAALLVLPLFPVAALAQDVKAGDERKQETAKKDEEKKEKKEKKNPDVEKYEKAIKDAERFDGEFTLYLRKNDVLLELPEEDLDRVFLVQATLHSGYSPLMGQAGEPITPGPVDVFKWRRNKERLLLVRPRTRFRWDESDPLSIASERTFPEAILGNYRIEQKHPEKKLLLVNVTSFFQGTVFQLQRAVSSAIGGSASLDRELTGVDRIKNYDDSTVVRMNVHFKSQGGGEFAALMAALGFGMPTHLEDSRSVPFKVTYSLWYRQESDYVPRLSDPRVGYFTQDFFSVSRFGEMDRTGRYIARFDVRKKNPAAKMSEPAEPIVWYVDTSVPKKYRPAVRAGVMARNSSFERIGIKNAIVVKDAPDNDPDWDHADGRHNVVRWIMSENTAYAVAWFGLNPFTANF